ncbi:MAG: hypothetical protein Q9203_001408 [Teloschistes exilis]
MYPNPCVVESYCGVLIRGEFTTSLENTTPRVSFNVTSHLPNNRTGLIRGEDVFCNWADIIQDGDDDDYNNHHLQTKARAQALAQANVRGYVPKTNFTVKVKAMADGQDGEKGKTIFDLWAEFELRDKDEA